MSAIRTMLADVLRLKCDFYEYARYKVQSKSGAEPYLVDLLENDGKGKCDCADWHNRIGPVIHGTHVLTVVERESFAPFCQHVLRATLAHAAILISAQLEKHQPSSIKHHATSYQHTRD